MKKLCSYCTLDWHEYDFFIDELPDDMSNLGGLVSCGCECECHRNPEWRSDYDIVRQRNYDKRFGSKGETPCK